MFTNYYFVFLIHTYTLNTFNILFVPNGVDHIFSTGYQTSTMVCIKEHNQQQQIVADKRCHGLDKPQPQVLRCNVKPCEAQ